MSKETSSEQTTATSTSNKNEKESKQVESAQTTTVEPPSVLEIETNSTQPPPIPPLSTQPDNLPSPDKTANKDEKLAAPLVEPEVSTSNLPTPTTQYVETNTSSTKIIETKYDMVQSNNGSPYKSSIAPRQTVISRRANVNSTVIANQTAHLNSIASNPISMRGSNNVVGQVIKYNSFSCFFTNFNFNIIKL
jgi:hypothetical protein